MTSVLSYFTQGAISRICAMDAVYLTDSRSLLRDPAVIFQSFNKIHLNKWIRKWLATCFLKKWYRTSVDGKQEHFFSSTMADATIVDINCQMPHCQAPSKADFTQLFDGLAGLPQN